MDWADFEAWLSADLDLAEATVKGLMRHWRTLEKRGADWMRFARAPDEARQVARHIVRRYKAEGKFNAARLSGRLFNHVARYKALDDDAWLRVKWELTQVPDYRLDPYEPAELAALASYRHVDSFVQTRRRAAVYLCLHASPRRGAVASMRVAQLNSQRCSVKIPHPGKRGHPVEVALPWGAFQDGAPLQAWLDMIVGSEWLWMCRDGSRLSYGGWGRELSAMSKELDFQVNFNRFRHNHATLLDDHDVPAQRAQDRFGWRSPRPYDHYRHTSVEKQRATMQRHGIPGYESLDADDGAGD